MNKTLLAPLALALAVAGPAAASMWPDDYYSAFQSRIREAEGALDQVEAAARQVQDASRACTAAQGAAAACEGLEQSRQGYDRLVQMYEADLARVAEARSALDRSVSEYLGQECGPTNLFQRIFTSGIATRNCESNKERYRGYAGMADQAEAALNNRVLGLSQSVEQGYSLALRHRGAAATAVERQAAADRASLEARARGMNASQIGEHIYQCRLSQGRGDGCSAGDLEVYRQVYQEQTGVALGADQMPPVRTLEEACAAWGSPTRVPPVNGNEICQPGGLDGLTRDEAQQKILVFLRNGPGRRVGCNSVYERCLPEDFDEASEAARRAADLPEGVTPPPQVVAGDTDFDQATRIATDIARDQTNRQTALDGVLSRGEDGPVECQGGGASLFGLGVACGQNGALTPVGSTAAPEFVPTSEIAGTSILGNGATVMRGDTLGEIAVQVRRQAGRPRADLYAVPGGVVDLIAFANGIEDPNRIYPQDGVRVPTSECLTEAIDAPDAEARQVLAACESLVRVSGDVPANLSVAMRMARERLAAREAERGQPFDDRTRQEFLMDALNSAASPASDFVGVGDSVPAETFIRLQTERFGENYRGLITQVAADAAARGYRDDERFRLLYRRLREVNAVGP